MSKIMDDMRNEAAQEKVKETAIRLIKLGKISLSEIPECFPELSADDIKELETEVMQLA